MNKKLQHRFARIEKMKDHLLSIIEQATPAQFRQRPAPDQWSLSEILAHLQTSEHLSVQYVKKKMLGMDQTGTTHIGHELLMLLVKISQRLPFKFKAPKVVKDNTPSYSTKEELIAAWQNTREQMKEVLQKFESHHLTKKVYKHPVAGRLNIQHTVEFFGEHMVHHLPQLKKTLHRVTKK